MEVTQTARVIAILEIFVRHAATPEHRLSIAELEQHWSESAGLRHGDLESGLDALFAAGVLTRREACGGLHYAPSAMGAALLADGLHRLGAIGEIGDYLYTRSLLEQTRGREHGLRTLTARERINDPSPPLRPRSTP